jgi:hypothetical protein
MDAKTYYQSGSRNLRWVWYAFCYEHKGLPCRYVVVTFKCKRVLAGPCQTST